MTSDDVAPEDLFTCQKCGDCCKGYGGTFVTEDDIETICLYVGLDRKGFIAHYCQVSGGKPILAQGKNGYCIFWDQLCTIHAVKPSICRKWPFIESLLVDVKNWQMMAASCPGMRTDCADNQIKKCVSTLTKRSS
jgi:Fe-S-cluster containining protein